MKRSLIVCLIVLGVAFACVALWVLDDFIRIPPRALTGSNMWVLKRRILQFAHSHGELPHALTGLPEMQGYYNSTRDAWGREIVFEVSPSGIVSLRSLGRDGVVGGSDEDADMIGSFPARDSQGRWSNEMIQWSHDPFSR
jgi:Type II secretion system (T2SS), protein G